MALSGLFIILIRLFFFGYGKPVPFFGADRRQVEGSISEKSYLDINGVRQGMFLTSKNGANPVLLFLHGGPGMPEYVLAERYHSLLSDDFTVCWWEQRGTCLSYSTDMQWDDVTVEQLVEDALEITDHLCSRFRQEKIFLMGHSWGSFLGSHIAARAPEKYCAYIAVGQVSCQLESEKAAYEYMVKQYDSIGNKRMVSKLRKYPIPKLENVPLDYGGLRDQAMHRLGIGTTRKMKSVIFSIFLPVMFASAYTYKEKIRLWRGKADLRRKTNLWDRMISTDLSSELLAFKIPVYFLHGIYDYTASYKLAKSYFNRLSAPVKGFYTFYDSAHSPIFEEPLKCHRILSGDVLNGRNEQADSGL
jgi:pimeloyl-ACP methyl ester carboxylesterase